MYLVWVVAEKTHRKQSKEARPLLKWAGGKRALLPTLIPRFGKIEGTYFEPFLGAGSVALALAPETSKVLSDTNTELINVFVVARDHPEELIKELSTHANTREHFLRVRAWDRDPSFSTVSPIKRAARFIFLNKTCFNGLYRVNKSGYFNVPYGDQPNAKILDAENIRAVSAALRGSDLRPDRTLLLNADFLETVSRAGAGDLVYADPPYDPASGTANFVSYQPNGFGSEKQIELRDQLEAAHGRGARVIASNNDTPFIREIYSESRGWKVEELVVKRAISASASGRVGASEVLLSLT